MNECLACGKPAKNKFCSRVCAGKFSKGGYRQGSGRSKSGYYKGIFCASTYELVWVIYRIDHNLPVNRFEGYIEGNGIRYFPDFVDNNTIFEIKGYYTDIVDKKIQIAMDCGYEIFVLYKKDLQNEFKWVNDNYSFSTFQELYDDFKPKYLYKCSCCGIDFAREHQLKTTKTFCSRQCAGKSHIGVISNKLGNNQYKKIS